MSSDTGAAPAPTPAAKVITRSEVQWRGAHLFEAGPAGRTHMIDANAKTAPGPVETLLNALVACTATDIVDIIAKRRTPIERMAVSITAERRPEHPRRVIRLDLEFRIDGPDIEREHAERAIEISHEKYCSVAASLNPDIVTHTKLVLNGEEFPPVEQGRGSQVEG